MLITTAADDLLIFFSRSNKANISFSHLHMKCEFFIFSEKAIKRRFEMLSVTVLHGTLRFNVIKHNSDRLH